MKKLTKTQEWMERFPADRPCPEAPGAAKAWRRARWETPYAREMWRKYDAALAEKREREGQS
jgi:hypothetical protein